jgi:glutamate-1-semialdehyde 2,1-aminomutase
MRAPDGFPAETLKSSVRTPLFQTLQLGMLLEGVDLFAGGGLLGRAHTAQDIDDTIAAFGRVLDRMRDEGVL